MGKGNVRTVAIVGAGSWGTALAIHAAECGHRVRLWVHSQDTFDTLTQTRQNRIYLPDFPIPDEVEISSDPACITNADYVLFVIPSTYFRETFIRFLPHLQDGSIAISAIKGMEPETHLRISEIVQDVAEHPIPFAVLSGPSFAVEVAQKHPTAVVIGSESQEIGQRIQNDLSSSYFRLYYNPDVLGIELGGSIKNIIAIAAGVVSGLGYGYNTLSGLITRGLTEMNRLAIQLGAHPSTLAGLAGLGDLILTCTGHLSRNRQVGVALGQGKSIQEIIGKTRMVAEGVRTTKAIHGLAQELRVSMPITEQVFKVLYEQRDPQSAILELMQRELKQE